MVEGKLKVLTILKPVYESFEIAEKLKGEINGKRTKKM